MFSISASYTHLSGGSRYIIANKNSNPDALNILAITSCRETTTSIFSTNIRDKKGPAIVLIKDAKGIDEKNINLVKLFSDKYGLGDLIIEPVSNTHSPKPPGKTLFLINDDVSLWLTTPQTTSLLLLLRRLSLTKDIPTIEDFWVYNKLCRSQDHRFLHNKANKIDILLSALEGICESHKKSHKKYGYWVDAVSICRYGLGSVYGISTLCAFGDKLQGTQIGYGLWFLTLRALVTKHTLIDYYKTLSELPHFGLGVNRGSYKKNEKVYYVIVSPFGPLNILGNGYNPAVTALSEGNPTDGPILHTGCIYTKDPRTKEDTELKSLKTKQTLYLRQFGVPTKLIKMSIGKEKEISIEHTEGTFKETASV